VALSFAEHVAGHYISPFHDIPLKADCEEVWFLLVWGRKNILHTIDWKHFTPVPQNASVERPSK